MRTTLTDVPTQVLTDQLEFLDAWLPDPPARVLDAGCGRGELAAALAERGHAVTAVDADPDAVAAARGAGVPAVLADIADFAGGPFDVVVFSLSLHHVGRLDETVARAAGLLAPGGVLVLDEFGWDAADRATATWFSDVRTLLDAAGVLSPGAGREPAPDALERWRHHHRDDDPMHSAADMLRAIAGPFRVVAEARVPYLHRYLGGWLGARPGAAEAFAALRAIEAMRVDQGELRPVGLRVVATHRGDAA
ncbi:class I SAM-dependent methyltransferase [Pseudonocardia lacus]|uniref:class I SAM-dependent methyltransferase n=1 Tax=Pseudonocardia lacus TaxID=2835865 RepID=UPI0027E38690|nr:methyltransferase domain-containing protein [Pseudonocardia lacus]